MPSVEEEDFWYRVDTEIRMFDLARLRVIEPILQKYKCKYQLHQGAGVLEVNYHSSYRKQLFEELFAQISKLPPKRILERIVFVDESGKIKESNPALLASLHPKKKGNFAMYSSSYADQMERLKERVHKEYSGFARSLVSLETHQNIEFNQELENMLGVSGDVLRSRNLLYYWQNPQERSLKLPQNYVPVGFKDFIKELNQKENLSGFSYPGWKENQYGVWTADVELIEVKFEVNGQPKSEFYRLMTSQGFNPLN